MTVCNMSIEGGARAGLIAPDETTFAYLKGRDHAQGCGLGAGARLLALPPHRRGAPFDKDVVLDGAAIARLVTWGTNPAQVTPISASVPDPETIDGLRRP